MEKSFLLPHNIIKRERKKWGKEGKRDAVKGVDSNTGTKRTKDGKQRKRERERESNCESNVALVHIRPKALPQATKIKCVCAHSQLFELVPMITVQRKKPPATGHQDITFRPKGKNLTDDAF
ncbi:hypothetical protein T01_15546 [Trichinella spiralis]|uniref:Uncharacterized protein n=1 Tax=Trichinella spiralis TaxID=6334 RepID=A0A0V1BN70_TRISP|nr:hypothetical protein T01_15546 [Trichinella spiralis]